MTFPVKQPYVITTKYSPIVHPGLDIAPTGNIYDRPCVAPENGVVTGSGYVATLEGNYIILKGDSGYFYYFGHFSSRSVFFGQRVTEGQQIGIIGMTGKATGIHTHHEVRKTQVGNSIDPEQYYKKENNVVSPTRKAIPAKTVAEHFSNYLGATVNPSDPACQGRFEDPSSDEFWYGLVTSLNDIRKSHEQEILDLKARIANNKNTCTAEERQLLDLLKKLG